MSNETPQDAVERLREVTQLMREHHALTPVTASVFLLAISEAILELADLVRYGPK